MSGEYEPILVTLDNLPELPGENNRIVFDLTKINEIPQGAKEVFVYTFVTVGGEGGPFQRGYYTFHTSKGNAKHFMQYMNVATGQHAKVLNSANMWFPFGDGKLTVELTHPQDKKSIAAKSDDQDKDWSKVFIIGYRM